MRCRSKWSAYILGFGMAGFFDGILLHQVLQWHHLLYNVRTGGLADLRGQVLADGAFHVLMYLVVMVGLWFAVTGREELAAPGASRRFLSAFLIGFGAWNFLDIVLFHWVVGIHRVRMEVDSPLFWDLLWLGVFGGLPLAFGVALQRDGGPRRGGIPAVVPLLLIASTMLAGAAAIRPLPRGQGTVAVVLRATADRGRLFAELAKTDSRLLWVDRSGAVWVLKQGGVGSLFGLYRQGALYVSGTASPGGCSSRFAVAQGQSR